MSLKKLIESLEKEKNELSEKEKNLTEQNFDDIPKICESIKNNEHFINEVSSYILKTVPNIETIFKMADNVKQDNKEIDDLKQRVVEDVTKEIKDKGIDIPNISNLSFDNASNLLNNKDALDIYNKKAREVFRNFIYLKFRFEPVNTFSKIENEISNKDEIENNFKSYVPITKRKRNYEYRNNDKLNELSKNADIKKDIEYLKENVFKQRNATDHDIDASLAEDGIGNKKKAINLKNAEVCKQDPYFSKHLEYSDVVQFTYINGQNNITDIDELDRELKNREINIPKDKQDILLSSLNMLDKMKNYQTNEDLLDTKEFSIEEKTKIYAYKNFSNLYQDIEKAVNENDVNKIKKLTSIHKKEMKEMNDLHAELDKLGNDNYPGNVSCARTEELPVEFEENYKMSSTVNGLWEMAAFLKLSKIDPKEFVKKPVESYIKFVNDNKGVPEIEELGKNGSVDFLKNVTNNNTRKLLIKTIANKYNNFRALEFIVSVDNKEYEKNSLTYQYMKQVKVNTIFNEKLRDAQDIFSTLKPENIKNVLLKQGDTKYVDAFNKNFNSKEYIKNTEIDPKKIVDSFDNIKKECSNNSFNGNEKDIEKAVKLASYEIVTNKNLLNSKEFSKLCNLGGIESYKAIRAVSGTRDIAKFLKSNVDESTKDGINKDNIDLSANTLKVLNDQYSKRGFFGRFFRKEARDENKLINTLKDNFKKAGINENEINSFLKGETEISSLGGNIKEDKKVLLDIKSLDEDFTLSKEELDNSKTLSKNLEQDLSDELEV